MFSTIDAKGDILFNTLAWYLYDCSAATSRLWYMLWRISRAFYWGGACAWAPLLWLFTTRARHLTFTCLDALVVDGACWANELARLQSNNSSGLNLNNASHLETITCSANLFNGKDTVLDSGVIVSPWLLTRSID